MKQDKARLHELKLKIWALVADNLIDKKLVNKRLANSSEANKPTDASVLTSAQIESHNGRLPKALRLLESNDYIVPSEVSPDNETYQVLRFEESQSYGLKPEMTLKSEAIDYELTYVSGSAEKLARVGYFRLSDCAERIYLWWHLDEYDVNPQNNYVYEKAKLNYLRKEVMRAVIERRIKIDFPGYVQMIAPSVTTVSNQKTFITVPNPISFKDFNLPTLEKNLNHFETALEQMEKHNEDLNTVLNIASGQFASLMELIRKTVINDFLNGYERFPKTFNIPSGDVEKHRSRYIFQFFDMFRDLCSYETLYLDPELGGPEIKDVSLSTNSWSRSISNLNFEKEFGPDEEENTRVA